jgi:pyridoxine kinase
MDSLAKAIQALHNTYRVPHVVITSVNLSAPDHPNGHLSVVGSSMTSQGQARLFKIVFPSIDCYFSGTGDMFAALMVIRMRQAVSEVDGLAAAPSWLSGDDTAAADLPLARAAERVLASMHELLTRTNEGMRAVVERTRAALPDAERDDEAKLQLLRSKGAELQLVRNLDCLRNPTTRFQAKAI